MCNAQDVENYHGEHIFSLGFSYSDIWRQVQSIHPRIPPSRILITDRFKAVILDIYVACSFIARPRGYNTFSCSSQLSMKFILLINLNLLKIANSFLLNIAEHENFSANKYENANYCWLS